MDYTVPDSTLWVNKNHYMALDKRDASIKIGIVRESDTDSDGTVFYRVELQMSGKQIVVDCFPMTRFGGAYNYEEYGIRGYLDYAPDNPLSSVAQSISSLRSGDLVIVAYVNGNGRFGVLLGGIKHGARSNTFDAGELAYESVFNGIQTTISNTGAYKLTFNGLPVNTPALDAQIAGVTPILPPVYDPVIAGSYLEFDITGSFTVSDGLEQSISINKALFNTSIKSGTSSITMQKDLSISASAINISLSANAQYSVDALTIAMSAKLNTSIKTTQFAVGNSSFELIDGLIKLIDALGTLITTSPVGPNSPLAGSPTWAQVLLIRTQLQIFKGSL